MLTFKTLIAPALGIATLMAGLNVPSAQAYQYKVSTIPAHNASEQACKASTQAVPGQIARKWLSGACYTLIAAAPHEFSRKELADLSIPQRPQAQLTSSNQQYSQVSQRKANTGADKNAASVPEIPVNTMLSEAAPSGNSVMLTEAETF